MTQSLSRSTLELAATPARIALIVVLAVVLRALLHRAIKRLVTGAAEGVVPVVLRPLHDRTKSRLLEVSPLLSERRRQRADTIGSVLRSVATVVVFGIATAMVLSELGFKLGPVLASAGIVGVAVGFGAQNLIKDFLNGMFMILEDQYGVGDAVDVGEASGIVEAVGLRTTRLRSVDGTVWHVRNGEVLRVGNMSQGWSRALLDVSVAYGTDVDHAQTVIKRVADEVWHDEAMTDLVLDEPEVWGVEQLGADGMAIRLVVKTAPLEQWKVARELRRRLKEAFEREGIEIPFPQRALWLRTSPEEAPAPVTDAGGRGAGRGPAKKAPRTPRTPRKAAAAPAAPVAGGEADVARSDSRALVRPPQP